MPTVMIDGEAEQADVGECSSSPQWLGIGYIVAPLSDSADRPGHTTDTRRAMRVQAAWQQWKSNERRSPHRTRTAPCGKCRGHSSCYVRHGIYVGNGEFVHELNGFLRCGPVKKTTLASFSGGYGFRVEPVTLAKYVEAEIVRRATARLGEDDYRLLTNNCEHFCTWGR